MIAGILAFFISPIGRLIGLGVVLLSLIGGVYFKGRLDGKAAYQASLNRQIEKTIAAGNKAGADALRKFDAQKDLPDDGFARD